MSKLTIKGHEFECNIYDAVFNERLESAKSAIAERAKARELGANSDYKKLQDDHVVVSEFFDLVLGDGSLHRILGDEEDPVEAIDAFCDLAVALNCAYDKAKKRSSEVAARAKLISDKYDPAKLKRG